MKSMNRRIFLKAAGGMMAALTFGRSTLAGSSERPNLLIIHTDEHHFRTLGCYGGTIVKTPNIDFLAARGALCEKFYATSPVCTPSRAAFVSGRYPQNTPAVSNNIPLSDDTVTFAEILRRQGYATGYAGKWHLDGAGKPQWAPQRKFGFEDNRYMFNRGHWKKMADTAAGPAVATHNAKGQLNYDVAGADEKSFTTDWLANKTIDFIDSHKGKPFCYMVSIPDPHGPNTVRAPYDTMFDKVEVQIPATFHKSKEQTPAWAPPDKGLTEKSLKRLMLPYYGMVKCIDDNVGRILDALRKNGILDRTIVVFAADHGDLCGEHKRLNKGVPYEGSAKVPFIMYYPTKIKPGTVIDKVLGCVDFLPTVFGLMGIEIPKDKDGRDASMLFSGRTLAGWKDITFMRIDKSWLCAVTGRYKIIYASQGVPWLLDLEKNPDELTNFYADPHYKLVVKELAGELMAYCKKYNEPHFANPKIRAEIEKAVN